MKKVFTILMVGCMLFCLCACALKGQENKDNEKYKKIASNVVDCNEFILDKYMLPYWNANIIYNESVMPLKNKDGAIEAISLMYDAGAIVSVKSSKLNKIYEEGIDYVLEDGKLKILDTGSIPLIEYDYIYPSMQIATMNPNNVMPHRTNGYMYFAEGSTFHYMQLAVTYVPKGKWDGSIPARKSENLPNTMAKLKKGEEIKVVVYGDSISVGANSSKFINSPPYCENYYEMVAHMLEKQYESKINLVNSSEGGVNSGWGAENAEQLVAELEPDLVLISFGMNDGSNGTNKIIFQRNIKKTIDTITTINPNCEFILVSPMLQNPDWATAATQGLYLDSLIELETEGCVVADVTSMHDYLLTRKRYIDMTGNHVNHPNDFIVRLYAQVVYEIFQDID